MAVLSLTMISAGCAGNALQLAAADTGKAQAGVNLPDLPDDCRVQEAHAPLYAGAEALVVLRQERRALDRQNARTMRCAAFYDTARSGLETAP